MIFPSDQNAFGLGITIDRIQSNGVNLDKDLISLCSGNWSLFDDGILPLYPLTIALKTRRVITLWINSSSLGHLVESQLSKSSRWDEVE
jgi:hypothetical protein